MSSTSRKFLTLMFLMSLIFLPTRTVYAQLVVHDPVSNVTRIAEQIENLAEYVKQYEQLVAQYKKMQEQYKAITGPRAVGNMFTALTDRKTYRSLPPEARDIVDASDDVLKAFSELARRVKSAKTQTSALTDESFKDNPYGRETWQREVRNISTQRASGETFYDNASERVKKLEDMISAIGATEDTKASADLTARMTGELMLLQNQQIQLRALQMVEEAYQRQTEMRQGDLLKNAGKDGIPNIVFPKLFE